MTTHEIRLQIKEKKGGEGGVLVRARDDEGKRFFFRGGGKKVDQLVSKVVDMNSSARLWPSRAFSVPTSWGNSDFRRTNIFFSAPTDLRASSALA